MRSGAPGAEVVAARVDEPEGLLGAAGQEDRVADDLAVEIDVGLGDGGDAGELRWEAWT
jgi:hypothetical protein